MTMKKDIKNLINEMNAKDTTIPQIVIEKNALQYITSYLNEKQYKNVVLVVDEKTKQAAGDALEKQLSQTDIHATMVILKPNKHRQVIADEQTVMQLFTEVTEGTDVVFAVGSGTIHDVVRFVGNKMRIPFISVPTAASVDGFTSKGAPLIFRGFKQTIQTASPIAVFADINVLKQAPQEMTAAGFGDMVGKYTSLLDWKISSLIADEPYSKLAADLTKESLETCVKNVREIADRSDKGITILIEALIQSGLVMLVLDFSRPASGSEHHLSHYWEMDLLKRDAKQLLHGEKVGVATAIIIDLYKQLITHFDIKSVPQDSDLGSTFKDNWDEIKEMMSELPNSAYIRNMLESVGGATTPEALNIDPTLVSRSLNEAFHLRDRCTGLFLTNQFKKEPITYPFEK